jgi:3-deoxy-manno-octulosonate cytidylyltransferase (CMP-KDO synthetase)
MSFLVVIDAAGEAGEQFKVDVLVDICGKPLVVRVAQRAQTSKASAVIVASDKKEILAACEEHGIKTAMIPDNDPKSFFDRIAEIALELNLPSSCAMVSVPRNEPLVSPDVIDATAALVFRDVPMESSIYMGDYPPKLRNCLPMTVVKTGDVRIHEVPLPSQCKNFGQIKEWYSRNRMSEVIAIGAGLWEGLNR